ncbi:MAG: cryptochrome/photolyase family protein [Lunatimonas sp.]|uniref:cryptochrome/photolyase family protein n=1 Tax=Lunatimonas sp. TaxID=2060141 RepID=UPI00263ACB00|nr:cryptochrome/photolyase family protein [Lunatimonas sp.]MCC5939633.1 cryptochrome/photolyase family protein [Lunatimonas sp.]
MGNKLRLLLGDQLNYLHSWFKTPDPEVVYLMMEMRQETDYVVHHIQKVVAFFAAMRSFAGYMQAKGHAFRYLTLDDPANAQNLTVNLETIIEREQISSFEYMLPDEYRLDQQLDQFCRGLQIPWRAWDSEHFITEREFLKKFFHGKKTFLMESFYRQLRKQHSVLMDGSLPQGDRWNFDSENRGNISDVSEVPELIQFSHHVDSLVTMLKSCDVKTLGMLPETGLDWPIGREDSLAVLDFFCETLLPSFGKYQDAMHTDSRFLFHSKLSFALNTKMLAPLEVIRRVESVWSNDPDMYPLAGVEGFIRQILGWREYMRGVYWARMPEYAELNFFGHTRSLPRFFWTGETKMNCMSHAINQSLQSAYAHHIQRLMVTGNFALLAGIAPDEVDAWYLGIYIDAIQWVEITNTRGMSQYADGGLVGTKPYVSSANYIDKMSNYCGSCYYDKNKKLGFRACPFNSLYWAFYERHRPLLEKNPRIGFVYRTLDRMKSKEEILAQAEFYLQDLNSL